MADRIDVAIGINHLDFTQQKSRFSLVSTDSTGRHFHHHEYRRRRTSLASIKPFGDALMVIDDV